MLRTLLARNLTTLATVLLTTLPAPAIDDGRFANHNRLTDAIGTLTAGDDDSLGLSRFSEVLIGPALLLTAAHCVRGDPLASMASL